MGSRLAERIVEVLFIAAIVASVYVAYHLGSPAPSTVETVATPAAPAPEVRKASKVDVPITRPIRAYKPAVKEALKLPDAILHDDTQVATAATRIEAGERPKTVTAVLDTKTGETTQFVKLEPAPILALESRGGITLAHGWRGDGLAWGGKQITRLSIRHDFLQIKDLHVGVVASLDSDGQKFAGVGLSYRW